MLLNKKKRLRGRPEISAEKAKSSITTVRFTKEERTKYEGLAKIEGLRLAEWVRRTLQKSS